jgi:recombinational DNA repair protein (RecF pathway)
MLLGYRCPMSNCANGATTPQPWSAETAFAQMVAGAACSHCVYPFANRRANREKLQAQDKPSFWLAARRQH